MNENIAFTVAPDEQEKERGGPLSGLCCALWFLIVAACVCLLSAGVSALVSWLMAVGGVG